MLTHQQSQLFSKNKSRFLHFYLYKTKTDRYKTSNQIHKILHTVTLIRSGPQAIVQDDRVVGFSDAWFAKRKFPVDIAGFAININIREEPQSSIM